jgi:hypothetical protein
MHYKAIMIIAWLILCYYSLYGVEWGVTEGYYNILFFVRPRSFSAHPAHSYAVIELYMVELSKRNLLLYIFSMIFYIVTLFRILPFDLSCSVTMGGECAKGSRSNKTLRYHVEDGIFQRKIGKFWQKTPKNRPFGGFTRSLTTRHYSPFLGPEKRFSGKHIY